MLSGWRGDEGAEAARQAISGGTAVVPLGVSASRSVSSSASRWTAGLMAAR